MRTPPGARTSATQTPSMILVGGRTISAPAAIVSAVEDALRPFNVRIRDLPLTPERLLNLIRSKK